MKAAWPQGECCMINDFPYLRRRMWGLDASRATLPPIWWTPGWAVVKKYLAAITAPVLPTIYTNTDPDKQLCCIRIGRIYVAANLVEFVSSAKCRPTSWCNRKRPPAGRKSSRRKIRRMRCKTQAAARRVPRCGVWT